MRYPDFNQVSIQRVTMVCSEIISSCTLRLEDRTSLLSRCGLLMGLDWVRNQMPC